MKTIMLAFVFYFLLQTFAAETVPLSMMETSVDDMYDGCRGAMAKKVDSAYFPNEKQTNALFLKAWNKANACAEKKYKDRKDKDLTKDHLQAICAYTAGQPNIYEPFNGAVRDQANLYTTAFSYHSLHFWLTSAIQVLSANKPCRTTYRRSKITFTGDVNKEMRFGSFTSSSKKPDLVQFGKETCFHINTCFGAYIKGYSVLGKHEQEVLIPPYEKFKITKKAKDSYGNLTGCNTIFVLESANKYSKLNCKAI